MFQIVVFHDFQCRLSDVGLPTEFNCGSGFTSSLMAFLCEHIALIADVTIVRTTLRISLQTQ